MRRCYLVCYDVRNDKRLRRIHSLMKAYGEPWQYSVFYCTLKAIDRVRLENSAREMLNLKEDQLLIVDLGSNEESAREAATVLGQGLPDAESGTVVI
jgi:CRISPR-associated protein Cas2